MFLKEFNVLFAEYRDQLVRFLVRRVSSPEVAMDLAQDAYVRLLQADAGTGEIRDARAYLFRTAANLAIDHQRRHRLMPLDPSPTAAEAVADRAPTPEAVAVSRAELRALAVAIDALPPRRRAAFLLARVEGLTYVEIGQRLGMSPKTAFSHTVKALADLTRHARAAELREDQKKRGGVRLS